MIKNKFSPHCWCIELFDNFFYVPSHRQDKLFSPQFFGENYQEAKQLISHSFHTWFVLQEEVWRVGKSIYQISEKKSFPLPNIALK